MSSTRPNLLFVMADQLRHDFLGYRGAAWVRTPHLDRLADSGMVFTNCYTNAPISAPARIGLATGLNPSQLGAHCNNAYLPASVPTYYQRLREHGYRVGCVGKLDLAKPDTFNGIRGDRPCAFGWGFTHPVECEGKMHAGMSTRPAGPYGHWLQEQGLWEAFRADYATRAKNHWIKNASHDSVLPTSAFADCYIGRRAEEWIEKIGNDFPWHLFVSFVGPHDPFDPPEEYARKYRTAQMPQAIEDGYLTAKPEWVRKKHKHLNEAEIVHTRRQYCAAIEAIDEAIGRILATLEATGQRENTYIVFSSDHGEMLGDFGLYTKGYAYEGSWHIPLLVCGPQIPQGQRDTFVELNDLNPTLCDLAQVPTLECIEARSFLPSIKDPAQIHRSDCVGALFNFRAIRDERYKLIENINAESELYDLQEDPFELRNIAETVPTEVGRLRRKLNARFLERKWLR